MESSLGEGSHGQRQQLSPKQPLGCETRSLWLSWCPLPKAEPLHRPGPCISSRASHTPPEVSKLHCPLPGKFPGTGKDVPPGPGRGALATNLQPPSLCRFPFFLFNPNSPSFSLRSHSSASAGVLTWGPRTALHPVRGLSQPLRPAWAGGEGGRGAA